MGAKAIFDISGIKVQLTTPRMVDVKKEVGIVTCEANVSADAGRFIFGFDLSSVKDPNEKSADQKAKEAASGKSTMDELAKLEGSSPIAAPPPENEKKDRLDVSTLAPLYSQMHAMRFKDGLSYAADIGKQTITMTAPATVPAAVFRYSAQFVDKGDKVLVQAVQQ